MRRLDMRAVWLGVALTLAACGRGGPRGSADGGVHTTGFTWVPLPGTVCANGTATGVGVDRVEGGTGLVVFFEGGGACWDYNTCIGLGTAEHLTGFGPADLTLGVLGSAPLFDRTDPQNPFRNDSFVFVPYCTGDVFTGDREQTYTGGSTSYVLEHRGYANVTRVLAWLTQSFPGVQRLSVVGTSAGGYGALFNYGRLRAAFPAARAFLVADASPPLRPPYFTQAWYQAQATAWGSVANLPPDCPDCSPEVADGGMFQLFPYYAKDPSFRGSLLAATQDVVISFFGALPPGNPNLLCSGGGACLYPVGLADLTENVLRTAGPGQAHVFLWDAGTHGLLNELPGLTVEGTSLEAFLQAQLGQGGSWQDVGP